MRDGSQLGQLARVSRLFIVAGAACCLAICFRSVGLAEDPYTNRHGVTAGAGFTTPRFANASLNPNGIGQLLYGTYYDVRPVLEPNGATDAQHVNIQILNTNPLGTLNGGILARVRFRESKTGLEVLAFDIALSCAEVWSAAVFLQGSGPDASAVPAIKSVDPIVSSVTSSTVTTLPEFNPASAAGSARPFVVPASVTVDDVRRGFFEVIAAEALPCEPNDAGGFSRSGNTYTRLTGAAATPTNCLSGEVFLIRAMAGVSFNYNLVAISRFASQGSGQSGRPCRAVCPISAAAEV